MIAFIEHKRAALEIIYFSGRLKSYSNYLLHIYKGSLLCPAGFAGQAGFRVLGSGFWVQGSGFRVPGSGFKVPGSGCCFWILSFVF
jgi:hypothetical protein